MSMPRRMENRCEFTNTCAGGDVVLTQFPFFLDGVAFPRGADFGMVLQVAAGGDAYSACKRPLSRTKTLVRLDLALATP